MKNAKIVKTDGRWVYFCLESVSNVTDDQAMEAQAALGYSPAGYSFYDFTVEKDPILFRYRATWRCFSSCD